MVHRSATNYDLTAQITNGAPGLQNLLKMNNREDPVAATDPDALPMPIRPSTFQPQERQIKYLGLVIEKDEEYMLQEDDL